MNEQSTLTEFPTLDENLTGNHVQDVTSESAVEPAIERVESPGSSRPLVVAKRKLLGRSFTIPEDEAVPGGNGWVAKVVRMIEQSKLPSIKFLRHGKPKEPVDLLTPKAEGRWLSPNLQYVKLPVAGDRSRRISNEYNSPPKKQSSFEKLHKTYQHPLVAADSPKNLCRDTTSTLKPASVTSQSTLLPTSVPSQSPQLPAAITSHLPPLPPPPPPLPSPLLAQLLKLGLSRSESPKIESPPERLKTNSPTVYGPPKPIPSANTQSTPISHVHKSTDLLLKSSSSQYESWSPKRWYHMLSHPSAPSVQRETEIQKNNDIRSRSPTPKSQLPTESWSPKRWYQKWYADRRAEQPALPKHQDPTESKVPNNESPLNRQTSLIQDRSEKKSSTQTPSPSSIPHTDKTDDKLSEKPELYPLRALLQARYSSLPPNDASSPPKPTEIKKDGFYSPTKFFPALMSKTKSLFELSKSPPKTTNSSSTSKIDTQSLGRTRYWFEAECPSPPNVRRSASMMVTNDQSLLATSKDETTDSNPEAGGHRKAKNKTKVEARLKNKTKVDKQEEENKDTGKTRSPKTMASDISFSLDLYEDPFTKRSRKGTWISRWSSRKSKNNISPTQEVASEVAGGEEERKDALEDEKKCKYGKKGNKGGNEECKEAGKNKEKKNADNSDEQGEVGISRKGSVRRKSSLMSNL